MTTAYLALKLSSRTSKRGDSLRQDPGCREGALGGGRLGDSRGQLTYSSGGYRAVLDLGKWWKQQYALPLPLGANRAVAFR